MTEAETFDFEIELEYACAMIRASFAAPQTPEMAARLLLLAKAATLPLVEASRDRDPANVEWLLPNTVDAIEQAARALQDALDELESVIDDVGIPEVGGSIEAVAQAQQAPRRGML